MDNLTITTSNTNAHTNTTIHNINNNNNSNKKKKKKILCGAEAPSVQIDWSIVQLQAPPATQGPDKWKWR